MAVLDLDLDFFVSPTHHWIASDSRLPASEFKSTSSPEVEQFLERQCGLSKSRKIPGRFCVNHDEAFEIWKTWIKNGVITTPFDVYHVDAHADMGLGDSSWTYLLTDFLALPLDGRECPRRGSDGLNCGSYLPFAIANRWLRSLTYVYGPDTPLHEGFPNDIHTIFFRNENWQSGPIELPVYSKQQMDQILMAARDLPEPLHREPSVPNTYVAWNDFRARDVSHMVLAQSPGYTPAAADLLIPIIEQYFTPV